MYFWILNISVSFLISDLIAHPNSDISLRLKLDIKYFPIVSNFRFCVLTTNSLFICLIYVRTFESTTRPDSSFRSLCVCVLPSNSRLITIIMSSFVSLRSSAQLLCSQYSLKPNKYTLKAVPKVRRNYNYFRILSSKQYIPKSKIHGFQNLQLNNEILFFLNASELNNGGGEGPLNQIYILCSSIVKNSVFVCYLSEKDFCISNAFRRNICFNFRIAFWLKRSIKMWRDFNLTLGKRITKIDPFLSGDL